MDWAAGCGPLPKCAGIAEAAPAGLAGAIGVRGRRRKPRQRRAWAATRARSAAQGAKLPTSQGRSAKTKSIISEEYVEET